MASSPSVSQDEIRRRLRGADRGVRCFVALSDASLDRLRRDGAPGRAAVDEAFAASAVVVEVGEARDVNTALEVVRQAREWLQSKDEREKRLSGLLQQALVDKAMALELNEGLDDDLGQRSDAS